MGIVWRRGQITYMLKVEHSHRRVNGDFVEKGPDYIHTEGAT